MWTIADKLSAIRRHSPAKPPSPLRGRGQGEGAHLASFAAGSTELAEVFADFAQNPILQIVKEHSGGKNEVSYRSGRARSRIMDQVSEADFLLRSGAVVKGAPTPNALA